MQHPMPCRYNMVLPCQLALDATTPSRTVRPTMTPSTPEPSSHERKESFAMAIPLALQLGLRSRPHTPPARRLDQTLRLHMPLGHPLVLSVVSWELPGHRTRPQSRAVLRRRAWVGPILRRWRWSSWPVSLRCCEFEEWYNSIGRKLRRRDLCANNLRSQVDSIFLAGPVHNQDS